MNRLFVGSLAAAALAGACLAPSPSHAASVRAIPAVSVTPTNFVSAFPAHLSAGTVKLQVTTPSGRDLTSVNLAQLHPGVKPATVRQLFKTGKLFPAFGLLRFVGGVDSVHGTTQTGLFDLPAGTYVAFSLDRLTQQHNASSPSTFITVSGAGAPAPQSVATITAVDFRFHAPATIPAGRNAIRFANSGKQPHELVLVRIAANKTLADVKMALMKQSNGPPPSWISNVGGWGVVSPGSAMWVQPNLTPGKYVMMCWVPDAFAYPGHKPTQKPHVMLGMIRLVNVR